VKAVLEYYAFTRGLRKLERRHRPSAGQRHFSLLGQRDFGLLGQRVGKGRWAGWRPGSEGREGYAEWVGWAKWTQGF
jgi:hypothetical protein